jgi:hypothetical protein
MANSDVKSKRLTGTGAAGVGRARLRKVAVLVNNDGAGRLTITDGNGGATILDVDFGANGSHTLMIPDNGTLAETDLHVATATNLTALTLFYA